MAVKNIDTSTRVNENHLHQHLYESEWRWQINGSLRLEKSLESTDFCAHGCTEGGTIIISSSSSSRRLHREICMHHQPWSIMLLDEGRAKPPQSHALAMWRSCRLAAINTETVTPGWPVPMRCRFIKLCTMCTCLLCMYICSHAHTRTRACAADTHVQVYSHCVHTRVRTYKHVLTLFVISYSIY